MNKTIIEKILSEEILEWSKLGSGICNTVYKATTNKNSYSIKVATVDSVTKESNSILVEAQITKELQTKNPTLLIPKIIYIDPKGTFFIYRFIDSLPLGIGNNEKYINTLLSTMGEFHHSIDCIYKNTACNVVGIKEYTLDDFFNKYGYEVEKYIKDKQLPEDYRYVLQIALDLFNNTKNNQTHEQILHNDIHGDNILVNASGELDVVIDFGDAVWGDVHLDMMWYVHGYPYDWLKVVDSYEKVSGLRISCEKLIALACIRFARGLCQWYLEGEELDHCNEKIRDYKYLLKNIYTLQK